MIEDLIDKTVDFYNKTNESNQKYIDMEGLRNYGINQFGFEENFLDGEEANVDSLKRIIQRPCS